MPHRRQLLNREGSLNRMRRSLVYFLCVSPLLAQLGRPEPQQAPIDALIQSYQSAYSNGRFAEAAANRDQARGLLSQIPVADPQFVNWAQRVSGIYENGGFGAQARSVLEQALTRVTALGDQSPTRVALLSALATSWQQDRNLLKALSYTEQAVAAAEAQGPQTAQAAPSRAVWFSASTGATMSARFGTFRGGPGADNGEIYQRLFNLYHQLGRPNDASAVLSRIAAHMKDSDGLLASLYQQQGQTDEAGAIYKRQAAQASDPQQAAFELQQLANLYQSSQRYADAASALQEAIGKTEASGDADATQRSAGMRQSLANLLQQAGQIQAADEVYRQLMAGQTNQQVGTVTGYAMFLAQTKRGDQAETLLKDYQDSHPTLQPWEQDNLLMTFANVEQLSGNPKLAEEYRRQASASRPQPPADGGELRVVPTLQHAQQLGYAGKLDEAFELTLQALDSASGAVDRESAPQMASIVAGSLAAKGPAKADGIYQHARGLAESFSQVTITPLVSVLQSYARSLASQQRWSEFDQVLEHYKATLSVSRGDGTGWLEDVLRQRTGLVSPPERSHDALAASQELTKLEESLSGATSEPYLHAIEGLARAMEANGDRVGALPFRRETVKIADLVYGANDLRRATTRLDAAMAYANDRQFEQAEELAREAVAIGQYALSAQFGDFTDQLQQILQMKKAAQSTSTPKQ
jgi:tetratricopeptide (TPR) repeat protein